ANKFTVGEASASSLASSAFGISAAGGSFTVQVDNTNTGAKGQTKTVDIAAGATIQDIVDSLKTVDSSLSAYWDAPTGKIQFKADSGIKVTINDDAAETGASLFGAASVNSVAQVAANVANPATAKTNSVTFGVSNASATVAKNLADFKTVMQQIDLTINDASYKGKNLLKGNDTMNVIFNEDGSSRLEVDGGHFSYAGDLKFSDVATLDWSKTAAIQSSVDQANGAIQILREESAKFGTAQSIIQTRQEFTTTMISTLKDGADRLTLADMNELAANSLALQTQRQLATNSLTMASQAAQSVLQMFR
ncbi:MAG: flagellin, partial [Alphaproteobacteria bacterium]